MTSIQKPPSSVRAGVSAGIGAQVQKPEDKPTQRAAAGAAGQVEPERARVDAKTQAQSRTRALSAEGTVRARIEGSAAVDTSSTLMLDPTRAKEVYDSVADAVTNPRETAQRVLDAGKEVAVDLGKRAAEEIDERAGVPIFGGLEKARMPKPEDMKPGDVYTADVGATYGGGRKALEVNGQQGVKMEIERTDEGYLLRQEMNVGLGAGVGPVKAGGTGKVETEYELKTPEDVRNAQKALGILARHPARAVLDNQKPATTEELAWANDFLGKRMKSATFKGEGAIEAARALGIPTKGVEVNATNISGKVSNEQSLKVNFEDQRVKSVEWSETTTGEGTIAPSLGLSKEGKGGFSVETPGKKASVSVTRKTTYEIPQGSEVAPGEGGVLDALRRARDVVGNGKDETTVKLQTQDGMRGHDVEVTLGPDSKPEVMRDAVKRAAEGDFDGVLKLEGADVKIKHTEWEKEGLIVKPSIDLGVVKGGANIESTTKRTVAKHEWPPPEEGAALAAGLLGEIGDV